ncbi:MAG: hypothetical protein HY000_10665, partial [Planctomycetes bacterium]|nr:hypothetical protein [Planctomycetota bacterium]
ALPLAGEPVEPGPSTPSVTEQQLRAVFDAALARLAAAGASESALGLLRTVQLQVIDLAGNYLGMAAAAAAGHAVVYIDVNAAGHGWFVDITPTQDEEFSALGEAIATSATAHADLLSVVLEELVRILDEAGLEHDNGLIVEPLAAGIRRLPRWVLDQVFAQWR